jgi:hypothetical protein
LVIGHLSRPANTSRDMTSRPRPRAVRCSTYARLRGANPRGSNSYPSADTPVRSEGRADRLRFRRHPGLLHIDDLLPAAGYLWLHLEISDPILKTVAIGRADDYIGSCTGSGSRAEASKPRTESRSQDQLGRKLLVTGWRTRMSRATRLKGGRACSVQVSNTRFQGRHPVHGMPPALRLPQATEHDMNQPSLPACITSGSQAIDPRGR